LHELAAQCFHFGSLCPTISIVIDLSQYVSLYRINILNSFNITDDTGNIKFGKQQLTRPN